MLLLDPDHHDLLPVYSTSSAWPTHHTSGSVAAKVVNAPFHLSRETVIRGDAAYGMQRLHPCPQTFQLDPRCPSLPYELMVTLGMLMKAWLPVALLLPRLRQRRKLSQQL